MLGWIIGGVVLFVVVLIVLWAISTYNTLIKMRNNYEEAFSTMDVFLKKRYDLIPNIVETVKGYAKHESETLEKVIKARNSAIQATSAEDKINADGQLTNALKSIFALSEAYPDLKANTNFMNLQNQLQKIEEEIAGSRRYYNAVVKTYNTKTEVFPSSIIASMSNHTKKPLYIINEEQRENVKVQF